jgi:SAM domain (Sterile alpha motif)
LWFLKTIIDLRPTKETSMDVGVWLRSLGLGQYEATFRDNEIDGAVLPKLTVDDLKDIGEKSCPRSRISTPSPWPELAP